MAHLPAPDDLIAFWFEEHGPDQWFATDAAFDALIRTRFGQAAAEALAGAYDAWRDSAEGCLALCLLLDQFPRNLHRGDAAAFAGDAKALSIAGHAAAEGLDRTLSEPQRLFLYLPYQHSESLEDQRTGVRLVAGLVENPDWLDYACLHLSVIHRFGRFPHRNPALGRTTTPEEQAYLDAVGTGF